jgi:hypothetical protein
LAFIKIRAINDLNENAPFNFLFIIAYVCQPNSSRPSG